MGTAIGLQELDTLVSAGEPGLLYAPGSSHTAPRIPRHKGVREGLSLSSHRAKESMKSVGNGLGEGTGGYGTEMTDKEDVITVEGLSHLYLPGMGYRQLILGSRVPNRGGPCDLVWKPEKG